MASEIYRTRKPRYDNKVEIYGRFNGKSFYALITAVRFDTGTFSHLRVDNHTIDGVSGQRQISLTSLKEIFPELPIHKIRKKVAKVLEDKVVGGDDYHEQSLGMPVVSVSSSDIHYGSNM